MYAFKVPPRQLSDLYRLKAFAGRMSIAYQIRKALDMYLVAETNKIGMPLSDMEAIILQHEREVAH
jgi:hypothetical protein